MQKKLGVMLLCHERHQYLRAIYQCLQRMRTTTHLQITANRPNSRVVSVIQDIAADADYDPLIDVKILRAPFDPLEKGERFMELRQWQLEHLPDTEYGVIWDDDHFLADPAEAHQLLHRPRKSVDLVYATKLFFWDSLDTITTHLPRHRSVFFFRRLPGDKFPTDRTIHAPAQIHDTAITVRDLKTPLLDYGYLSKADRERCWNDYKRAGKIDAATLALLKEPKLQKYHD